MNSLRKAWPLAKSIVFMATNVGLAILMLAWAAYVPGWINADQFIDGVQACYYTIFAGIAVAALWLLGAQFFLGDEER